VRPRRFRGASDNRICKPKDKTPLNAIAAPRAKTKARRVPEPVSKRPDAPKRPDAQETLRLILARLDDMKAEETVTIDLTGKTSIADAMVVTSGRSNRHVTSIADSAVEGLHKAGVKGIRVEGKKNGDWVLIDAGDVIVHVFRPEVRAFYDIEKMWAGAGARKQKTD
jgi:ribosome-associated protein